jgi:hypothetical protein
MTLSTGGATVSGPLSSAAPRPVLLNGLHLAASSLPLSCSMVARIECRSPGCGSLVAGSGGQPVCLPAPATPVALP